MQEKIREIRSRLRLSMNGVVSTSMREKGVNYKLNFGVPIPELRQMAKEYKAEATAGLSEELWKENVRELKILATMLYPFPEFTMEKALRWIEEIPYPEIAEQCVHNLFRYLSIADRILEWSLLNDTLPYARQVGFLLLASLSRCVDEVLPASYCVYWAEEAKKTFEKGPSHEQQAALQAMKNYGSCKELGTVILDIFSDYATSDSLVKQEIYNDLKFEFEYYR